MSWSDTGKLSKKAADAGLTVPELCYNAVKACGSIHLAAVSLGVYPNTIRWHLDQRKTLKAVSR